MNDRDAILTGLRGVPSLALDELSKGVNVGFYQALNELVAEGHVIVERSRFGGPARFKIATET